MFWSFGFRVSFWCFGVSVLGFRVRGLGPLVLVFWSFGSRVWFWSFGVSVLGCRV